MRVGDAAGLNILNTDVGTALSVHLDYVDRSGAVWRTSSLPSSGASPCTLSHAQGALGPSSLSYWLETEGLPSLSSGNAAVVLPCHSSPAGAPQASLLSDQKTIAILALDGGTVTSLPFFGFLGARGSSTGMRQAVSTNAQEFWVGGIASSQFGLRYLASRTSNTTVRVHGSLWFPETPPRYQAGSMDLRGVTLQGNQLYVTSSYVVEPNRNMEKPSYTPWGGVVRIGARGMIRRNQTYDGTLLRGFDGRRSFWTFLFEQTQSMWLIEDVGRYSRVSTLISTQADAAAMLDVNGMAPASKPEQPAASRPWFYRDSVGTAIVNWKWNNAAGGRWAEVNATKTYLPGGEAAYSLAGRLEPQAGGIAMAWTLYTTTRSRLYRVRPAANTAGAVEVVRLAPAGTIYRGVALPPYQDAPTASPSPTSSRTKLRPPTPSSTATRSKSRKPRREV